MQCWRCTSHNVALQVHTTLPGALNAFSLLGITTSLLTFKFSSLNLIIRGQEKLGKVGVGGDWRGRFNQLSNQAHTTLPGALNASSLLGITTSLLTFKFSSLILNLIVRGQGNGGKGGLGNWNWVLGGKGSPSPQNRPTQHSLGLLTFKFSSLILNIRGQENGGKGGGGGGGIGGKGSPSSQNRV